MSGARIVLSGIPTKTYYDPAVFVEETERIFRRHWGFACLTTEVTRPGAYLTANIGGDNVIVVRDENQLRAFHNVCLHRGAEIVSGVGTATEFKCPYHTWTYGLDGSLVRVPGVKKFPNAIGLRPLRLETWGPFVFVCSDLDIAPLAYFFGDLFDYFQDKVDLVEIVSNGTMEEFNFEIEANWKVVVENSLECYHCAYAHPGLASSIDLRKFEQWVEGWWSAQQAPQRIEGKNRGVALGEVTQASAKESGMNTARFNFLFPNMYISVWPGSHGFSTTEISTKGCHRTRTRHRRFFQNNVSQAEREESHAFISEVINEDIALCESVQRGLDRDVTDQRLMINQGRLGADETCILHFHELLQHKRERPTLESVRETNF